MEEELTEIYDQIKEIKINLRKLGPEKRKIRTKYVQEKYNQAQKLYELFKIKLNLLSQQQSNLELVEIILDTLSIKVNEEFKIIISYCQEFVEPSKMDKLDIKTAASLVPVMDSREETIEKIIDCVEMYESCLKEAACKKSLATFVLKTRLSKAAKLKLKSEYDNCTDLVKDMRVQLLTKKSANSLLTQLNNVTQNEMTIGQFAEKIEDLFVNLTISQK